MSNSNKALQASLRERYNYNPDTGAFTNAINCKRTGVTAGGIAGTIVRSNGGNKNNKRIISFGEKRHPVGNLIILYVDGYLPAYTGYRDKDYTNLKYDNIFPSAYKVINRGPNKLNRSGQHRAGQENLRELKIKVLDFMDVKVGEFDIPEAGVGVGASIGSVSRNKIMDGLNMNCQRVDALLRQLVIAQCIEYDRGSKEYHLLSRGRSRILDDGEDLAKKKLDLMLQFYGMMPNLKLPLNNLFGHGDLYFAEY